MAIRKICILGLEDYAMLTGDTSFGPIGGESVQHVLLARAWRDMGLDVSIIVCDHGQPRVTMIDGVRAVAAFSRTGGMPMTRFVHPRMTTVVRAMRELDADLYYQSPAASWSGVVALFAKRYRKSSVLRIASDSDCQRSKAPSRNGSWSRRMTYRRDRWMFDYGVLNASMVAAQTRKQRDLLARNFGIQSELLNIAVEVPNAKTSALEPERKDVDVLWMGNYREVKRPDVAIELARRLPQYRFAFVGGSVPTGEAYFNRIRDEARSVPNINFVGPVPYRETGDWFARSRLHVNTSDYEGFPNTFLQAWVRRVPVVSFFDPDGLVRRRGLGAICAGVEEMSAELDRLLKSPSECERIGDRAYAFATNEFSPHQIAAQYLELLEPKLSIARRAELAG